MNDKELNIFLKKHPLDFLKVNPIRFNAMSKDIPMYKWTMINSQKGIGLVHAYKLKKGLVIRSDRYYSKDARFMTYKEYDDWRREIKKLNGE